MNVFLIRNAQFKTNASMKRIAMALNSINTSCYIISRNRNATDNNDTITDSGEFLKNIEINIKSTYGKSILGVFNVFRYQTRLFSLLVKMRKQVDIVHVIDLDAALPVSLFSKIMRKKYIFHIADYYADSRNVKPKFIKNLIKKIEHGVINRAELVILCTEDRINQIKGSNPKQIKIIHNVPIINYEMFRSRDTLKTPLKFAYVGALDEKRFIKEILETFSIYSENILYIAGMGKYSDLAKKMSQEHPNITFLGIIDYDKALELYHHCDVIIGMYDPKIENHKYAAPNKVYESINLGRPIVFTKGVGLSDLVDKENFGWLVDYDLNSFKETIDKINKEEVILKSNNALSLRTQYSWEKIRNNIVEIYQGL